MRRSPSSFCPCESLTFTSFLSRASKTGTDAEGSSENVCSSWRASSFPEARQSQEDTLCLHASGLRRARRFFRTSFPFAWHRVPSAVLRSSAACVGDVFLTMRRVTSGTSSRRLDGFESFFLHDGGTFSVFRRRAFTTVMFSKRTREFTKVDQFRSEFRLHQTPDVSFLTSGKSQLLRGCFHHTARQSDPVMSANGTDADAWSPTVMRWFFLGFLLLTSGGTRPPCRQKGKLAPPEGENPKLAVR